MASFSKIMSLVCLGVAFSSHLCFAEAKMILPPHSNPYDEKAYDSPLTWMESQTQVACANETVGEGRAAIASATLERAQNATDEVKKRMNAVLQFLDDPYRWARDQKVAQKKQSGQKRIPASQTEYSPEVIRKTEEHISRAKVDLQGLQKVALRLDRVITRANGCYWVAVNAHSDSQPALARGSAAGGLELFYAGFKERRAAAGSADGPSQAPQAR